MAIPFCSRNISSSAEPVRVGSLLVRIVLNTGSAKRTDVFYVKNVPAWERIHRVLMRMTGPAFAAMHWSESGMAGVMGVMLAMTGHFGFCPRCAVVGRKLVKEA